ncbi:acyl-CoA synthetase (AMP-forming)/AMP-acid ligase II [Sphingobium sp. OAS761]|uniref:class I adenylate-forming enzyme family protein n=1 Tax=Sphingobium sp. OAS761 TaxID=2817901 RepID=UPI00209F71A2|nr:acyl-CoA synthetase (AMP-forming)/AMP-acid ligase II [Sphingobium sp. OAS761]
MSQLKERIKAILTLDAAAPAIEFDGKWSTWGEIERAYRAVDTILDANGLGNDSRIGLMLRNHAAVVPAVLAVIGDRCVVTLNPMFQASKLADDIRSTQVPVVVGISADLDAPEVAAALAEGGCLVLELTGDAETPVKVRQERASASASTDTAPGVAVEMLTSGTTGAPKRIAMKRIGFEESVFAAARFEKGRSADDAPVLRKGVQLLMAPFSHIGGLLALMNAVMAGRSGALLPKFTVEGFRDAVKRHGIKAASAPPAALKMVYDADVPREHLASLKAFRTGTAPLDPDLADAFYERYGIPVLQNYGATEFGGVAGWTIADFEAHRVDRRGAVGRLNPNVQGRVVDAETGAEVPANEIGILELKSRQIGDGTQWLRTTDLAKMSEDGFLWITGRADNVIIRGGFKIQPDDVVRALESHPAVSEASVIAMPDDRLGQVPVAAFLAASGQEVPSEAQLKAFLKEKLTAYQVPVSIRRFDALPRTPSMKVDQRALRELMTTGSAA